MGLLLFLMPVNYSQQKLKPVETITTFLHERLKGFGRIDWRELPHGHPVPLGVVDGSTRPDLDSNGCFRVDVNERWGWRTLEFPSPTIKRVRSEREPLV